MLISGPAGTGKSLACLYKMHFCASRVPGFRGLIVRKTRESLTESGLVTFEQHVLGNRHPVRDGAQRRLRQAYKYADGAEVIVGGMDKPGKVMSTEYDLVFVQEAIELAEEDWEALTTRLRNGRLPYQQLLADTNPSSPTHWLKRRCDRGRTQLLESRHEDNPRLWRQGAWTPEGQAYVAKLDALTGPRKHRLRFGRWVQAEGVVYDGWDAARHLLGWDDPRLPIPQELRDRGELPADWERFVSVDFGYTNPFVAQWWAADHDGRLYRYREIYRTRTLIEDHAREMRACSAGEPAPALVICDHDAEDRATLEKYLGRPTIPAEKAVTSGIQAVAERLRPQQDGRPRLFLLRDALVRRDEHLVEAKRPTCTDEEIDSYVWKDSKARDEPVKEHDHGCDAMRYMVAQLDLRRRINFDVTFIG